MQASMFNVQVPLADRDEVFLMNTFSDAQLLVSPDVAALLDRISRGQSRFNDEERETVDALIENGFVVESRDEERAVARPVLPHASRRHRQLRVTVLTTLQCNFACDYCFQGDHGDYNKFAEKMSLETASKVVAWIEERLDDAAPGKIRAHAVRRRAAAEPAGGVLPGRAVHATVRRSAASSRASASSPTACC